MHAKIFSLILGFSISVPASAWSAKCTQSLEEMRPICQTLPAQESLLTDMPSAMSSDKEMMRQISGQRTFLNDVMKNANSTSGLHDGSQSMLAVLQAQKSLATSYLTACLRAVERCETNCKGASIMSGQTPPVQTCALWKKQTGNDLLDKIRVIENNILDAERTVNNSTSKPAAPQPTVVDEYGYPVDPKNFDNGSPAMQD